MARIWGLVGHREEWPRGAAWEEDVFSEEKVSGRKQARDRGCAQWWVQVGRRPDVDPNEGCFELVVSDLEVGLGTLAGGNRSRQGVTWLLEACGGEATESKSLCFGRELREASSSF